MSKSKKCICEPGHPYNNLCCPVHGRLTEDDKGHPVVKKKSAKKKIMNVVYKGKERTPVTPFKCILAEKLILVDEVGNRLVNYPSPAIKEGDTGWLICERKIKQRTLMGNIYT